MQPVCWRHLVERNAAYVQFQDAPSPEVQVKMYVPEHILFVGYHILTFGQGPVFEIEMGGNQSGTLANVPDRLFNEYYPAAICMAAFV